jgi:hypothetical protein
VRHTHASRQDGSRDETDHEAAKFFKEEAMKHYRGLCFLIAWLAADPPGDCTREGMTEEIAPYADRASGLMCNDWRGV